MDGVEVDEARLEMRGVNGSSDDVGKSDSSGDCRSFCSSKCSTVSSYTLESSGGI